MPNDDVADECFCPECGRFTVRGDECSACGAVLCVDCGIGEATIETSHGLRCLNCAKAYGEPLSTRPPAPAIGQFFETLKRRFCG